MTEAQRGPRPADPGTGRPADHAQIHQLARRLVPALAARLAATGLGELEVREGGWRVRLRRLPAPQDAPPPSDEAPSRGEQGKEAEGRIVATSPAVGYFSPRPHLRPGLAVRAGDPLGEVDVLGVGQDVVAPADGVVAATLVVAGQAVEYGQELVVLLPMRPGVPAGVAGDAP